MHNNTYTLGTRGSLLALTQSGQVLEKLKNLSGLNFKIREIITQGDQIVDKPLWQIDGKDFFTKELDQSLLKGEIDFVVHSYKDLGSERPAGIKLAAITKRDFPQDILLIRKDAIQQSADKFIIGTSSPRRHVNLQASIRPFIPWHINEVKIENLRGNVNSRIQKLVDGQYDAIVLAFAGLERLAKNQDNHALLRELFKTLQYSILPVSNFPTAAAQGALAIEVGPHTPQELIQAIESLHHPRSADEVRWEKKRFSEFGGGCHLPMGITAQFVENSKFYFLKGKKNLEDKDQELIEETDFQINQEKLPNALSTASKNSIDSKLFVGLSKEDLKNYTSYTSNSTKIIADTLLLKSPLPTERLTIAKHAYITSKHTMHAIDTKRAPESIWCAGPKTWKRLAKKGFWVNGSSDQFGEDQLKLILQSSLLKLIHGNNFMDDLYLYTHENAEVYIGKKQAVYSHHMASPNESLKQELEKCDFFYWGSYTQFKAYTTAIPTLLNKKHYCGLGKSYKLFNENNITIQCLRDWTEALKLIS